jgi:aldose 1-epimerase
MTMILELRCGRSRVRVAPALGGRITSATLGRDDGPPVAILHSYPETALDLLPWAKGGIYPLVPYSGRIRGAKLMHEGRAIKLAPHPGGEPHTLHGIAHQRRWHVVHSSESTSELRYRHAPDAHWPWPFESCLRVTLEANVLRIEISLANTGDGTMPGGIGLHPYVPYLLGDEFLYEAEPSWPYDKDFLAGDPVLGLPSKQAVTATEFADGEVTRFHAGLVGDLLLDRKIGPGLRFTVSDTLSHIVVHRPAGSSYVCIEPVSHVADGFNLRARGVAGTGARILDPGEKIEGRMEIRLSQ